MSHSGLSSGIWWTPIVSSLGRWKDIEWNHVESGFWPNWNHVEWKDSEWKDSEWKDSEKHLALTGIR
jgi:hypothetical protein